ncbi:odorant receptor Or2-like [Nylanderia fulva]|nr:odorant receptor Or2-like [Nylanderia fulva]
MVGLWPKLEQNSEKKLTCTLRVFVICIGFSLIIPAIHSLIRIHTDIMLAIDNLHYTLPLISSLMRLMVFWWKKKALVTIVNMIAEDWLKSKSLYERTVMIKWAQRTRICVICAFSIMGIAYGSIVSTTIFGKSMRLTSNITDPGRPMLLQTYYIYDVTKRPQYEFTLILQIVSVFIVILPYTGIDTFLGLLVFHICGQLDILKSRLVHLHQYENFSDILKDSVRCHIRLLRAVAIVEDAYNIILLILLLYFGILFAFQGFLLVSLFDEEKISIIRLSTLLVGIANIFIHMCLYCAIGEVLMTRYDAIHYAVYNNEWYFLDSKKMKDLIIFMIKSGVPVYFTAGKIFPMTIAMFCSLLKTSAGYISFLLTTRN